MPVVLIIEDNQIFREQLRENLLGAGFEVQDAANGTDGMRLFERHRPAVVLTDLVMEGGEGIESIQHIRSLDPDVHIVAMSGNADYLQSSSKLGADRTLLKPFRIPELIAALVRPAP